MSFRLALEDGVDVLLLALEEGAVATAAALEGPRDIENAPGFIVGEPFGEMEQNSNRGGDNGDEGV